MKTLRLICSIGSVMVLFNTVYVPSARSADGGPTRLPADEDAAWNEVNSPRSARVQVLNERRSNGGVSQQARAATFLEAADSAREFYTSFPGSQRTKAARKMEVLNLIQAADAGAVEVEERARSAAIKFRNDSGNSETDRFQVAASMVHLEVGRKRLGTTEDTLAEYERLTDNLLAEFPNNPEVYRMYTGLMRNSDRANAARLAGKVINMASPGEIKALAQDILDQYELAGTQPEIGFDDIGGSRFELDSLKGKIVVIEVWNGVAGRRVTDAMLGEKRRSVAVVALNVDAGDASDRARLDETATRGAVASYFDTRGMQSPLARQLHVYDAPCVFVLDRSGTVIGSGRIQELTTLLAQAN